MTAEGKKRVQITLAADTIEKLNEWCDTLGISKSAATSMALADWLRRMEADHKAAASE